MFIHRIYHTSAERVDLLGTVGFGTWKKALQVSSGTWENFPGVGRVAIGPHPTKKKKHTNGANDRSTAEVLHGNHFRVELGVPFQLHAVAEMVEGAAGGHFDCSGCNRTTDVKRRRRWENGDKAKVKEESPRKIRGIKKKG